MLSGLGGISRVRRIIKRRSCSIRLFLWHTVDCAAMIGQLNTLPQHNQTAARLPNYVKHSTPMESRRFYIISKPQRRNCSSWTDIKTSKNKYFVTFWLCCIWAFMFISMKERKDDVWCVKVKISLLRSFAGIISIVK